MGVLYNVTPCTLV